MHLARTSEGCMRPSEVPVSCIEGCLLVDRKSTFKIECLLENVA